MGDESDITSYRACISTPGEVEDSYNDWNRIVFNNGNNELDSETSLFGGGSITGPRRCASRKTNSILTNALESLNDALKNLPSDAFVTSQNLNNKENNNDRVMAVNKTG